MSQNSQTQTRKRRAGIEQLKDAIKEAEESLVKMSEMHIRSMKNRLEGIALLVGKHCGVVVPEVKSKRAVLSPIPEESTLEPSLLSTNSLALPPSAPSLALPPSAPSAPSASSAPSLAPPKMESKARVVDQTFNKFRTDVSASLKEAGKPLTTDGNKLISDAWKSAKEGKVGELKNSLRTLGLSDAQRSPMAAKAIQNAQEYLSRAQTRKKGVKATPMNMGNSLGLQNAVSATLGNKTRRVSIAKAKKAFESSAPPASRVSPQQSTVNSSMKEVEHDGKKYYVLNDNTVIEKKQDNSMGEAVGKWDSVDNKILFSPSAVSL